MFLIEAIHLATPHERPRPVFTTTYKLTDGSRYGVSPTANQGEYRFVWARVQIPGAAPEILDDFTLEGERAQDMINNLKMTDALANVAHLGTDEVKRSAP